ncbi:MAG: hypothetical protein KAJ07_06280 [Planctomycetes bacterium]|nr:hypothetical protein [Planctomycetota bacterium]
MILEEKSIVAKYLLVAGILTGLPVYAKGYDATGEDKDTDKKKRVDPK